MTPRERLTEWLDKTGIIINSSSISDYKIIYAKVQFLLFVFRIWIQVSIAGSHLCTDYCKFYARYGCIISANLNEMRIVGGQ